MAEWQKDPYLHMIGQGFFPDDLYAEMLKNLPPDEAYEKYNDVYPLRRIYNAFDGFWGEVFAGLAANFDRCIVQLCRDLPGYAIGPHTDKPRKVESWLFYLTDKEVPGAGTSIFVPKRKAFICNSGKHHEFKDFELVKTAPYVPNGYMAFKRSDVSFHGVFPSDVTRNVIQLSVY